MGNRPIIASRSAAGTDQYANATDSEGVASKIPNKRTLSRDNNRIYKCVNNSTNNLYNDSDGRRLSEMKQIQREIAQENAAVLQRDVIENEWDSDFSTVSPSEMTTTDQSKLLSPLANQSTPFRLPEKKKKSSAKQKTTNNSRVKQSTVTTPSSLTSMDTWYGLPSLIETIEREELEAFTKPTPEDNEWVAQAHRYFDNEKVYTRKTSKPAVGRRLRIGKFQKKRWTSVLREMALRHPLPVNPAPFSLSKAMCELKLRPEKRFTMPNP